MWLLLTLSCPPRANYIMILDIDYVVSEEQEICGVDQFTDRTMEGRRYSDGFAPSDWSKRYPRRDQDFASPTNLFPYRIRKLAGMTAGTETEEFREILTFVIPIPTNRQFNTYRPLRPSLCKSWCEI